MTPPGHRWKGHLYVIVEDPDPVIGGFHLSLSAQGRKPTDEELQEAVTEFAPEGMELVETPRVVNPYVRHLMERAAVERV